MNCETYHVVDVGDRFVLFSGTEEECAQVIEESYAGLFLMSDEDLPSGIID